MYCTLSANIHCLGNQYSADLLHIYHDQPLFPLEKNNLPFISNPFFYETKFCVFTFKQKKVLAQVLLNKNRIFKLLLCYMAYRALKRGREYVDSPQETKKNNISVAHNNLHYKVEA